MPGTVIGIEGIKTHNIQFTAFDATTAVQTDLSLRQGHTQITEIQSNKCDD